MSTTASIYVFFRTAVLFRGRTTQILSNLSPKRGCGPKRVNNTISPTTRTFFRPTHIVVQAGVVGGDDADAPAAALGVFKPQDTAALRAVAVQVRWITTLALILQNFTPAVVPVAVGNTL